MPIVLQGIKSKWTFDNVRLCRRQVTARELGTGHPPKGGAVAKQFFKAELHRKDTTMLEDRHLGEHLGAGQDT